MQMELYEATSATGNVTLCKRIPAQMKRNGYVGRRTDGWVLVKWLDNHGGSAHVHESQLRLISNVKC